MNDYEMSTPINALKQNNVSNLVRNVENNLETLKNTNVPSSEPLQLNNDPFTYNPNIIPETRQELPPIPQKPQQRMGNLTYNPRVQIQQNQYQQQPMQPRQIMQPKQVIQEYSEENVNESSIFKKIAVNMKEYLIVILLFSLLAHKKVNRLFFNNVPGLNTINTHIPSLILRGTVMALILFAIKKFI